MNRLLAAALIPLFLAACGPGQEESSPVPQASIPASQSESFASSEPKPPPNPEPDSPPAAGENYIYDVADAILSELGTDSLPDDEKILAVYRWMIGNVWFAAPVGQDIWRYRSDQPEPPSFLETMSISPLVFGIGSCEDFACALTLLLERMGYEARYLPGFTISAKGNWVDHAWTLVKLDGEWFHLDSQLEQNILRGSRTSYRYFLKSDREMITDHRWGESLLDLFHTITAEEAALIRAEYTPPPCTAAYPQRPPELLEKAARPDIDAIRAEIEREKQVYGLLPEIPLNNQPPVLVAAETGKPSSLPPAYARSFLSLTAQELYDRIVGRASRFDFTPIPLEGRLPDSELKRLAEALGYDQPQLYWLILSREGNALVPCVAPPLTPEEVRRRQEEIDAAADALLAGASGGGAKTAEQLHDLLAVSITYDKTSAQPDITNLYGGLVRGTGVCDAYTRSYQYLLTRAGIENIFVAGSSKRGITHSWNALRLEDGWYYTDVTWDAPKDGGDRPYHDYLAVSYEEIALERDFLPGQYPRLPSASGGAMGYYRRNRYAVDPADGRLTDLLAEAFVRQLEDHPPITGGIQSLDAKLLCGAEEYPRYKREYVDGLFEVLAAAERLARQRGLPLRFETDGETGISFNDAMRIVVMHPRIFPTELNGGTPK